MELRTKREKQSVVEQKSIHCENVVPLQTQLTSIFLPTGIPKVETFGGVASKRYTRV